MVLEPPGGLAGAEVPQSETLVPGPGQGEVAVRGEHHVRHEMAASQVVRKTAWRMTCSQC